MFYWSHCKLFDRCTKIAESDQIHHKNEEKVTSNLFMLKKPANDERATLASHTDFLLVSYSGKAIIPNLEAIWL